MLDQRLPTFGTIALYNVENAGGKPSFMRDPGKKRRCRRRVLRCFQDRSVTADERWENLPGCIGDRRIGSDNECRHATGLANCHGVFVWCATRRGAAAEPLTFASEEAAKGNGASGFAPRFPGCLSSFRGDDFGNIFLPRLKRVTHRV